EGEVGALDSRGHVLERFFERLAEGVLVVASAELAAEGLGELFGHHLDAGGEAVSGLEDAREEVEGLWDLLGHGALAAIALGAEDEEREIPPDGACGERDAGDADEEEGDGPGGERHPAGDAEE